MNAVQKSLGDRMKEYEKVSNVKLVKRTPILIRADGRAFHTFTKSMKEPYDDYFIELMNITTKYLKDNIPDCKIAFVESDEITLGIFPYKTFTTEPMFDARIQKLCSVVASMATWIFNKTINEWYNVPLLDYDNLPDDNEKAKEVLKDYEEKSKRRSWCSNIVSGVAMFDARCWNLPKEEVLNCFLWRQQDSKRNAILSAGQSWIGKKAIVGLKCPEIIDKLIKEKDIDYWNNVPRYYHYGRTFTDLIELDKEKENVWIFDDQQDREKLESLVNCEIE